MILSEVERHVITSTLTDPDRDAHAIHPSEICKSDACKRQMYYRIVDTPPEFDGIDTTFWRERIYADGHDIHDKWQRWLWAMGKLYGYFECLACDNYWYARSPTECLNCGAHRRKLIYKEVPVENEEHMLVGFADGMLDEGLLEVKSIGKGTVRLDAPGFWEKFDSGEWTEQQLWNEIKRPFPVHVRQGMLYAYCKGVKQVIFIYECKWNQAVKEFVVIYNEETLAPVLSACKDIKYAVEKQRPPERPRWADEDAPVAPACKACPYRKACYGEVSSEETTGGESPRKWRVKRAS